MNNNQHSIFRILDANLNRLREALRVIEEYYRFLDEQPDVCSTLKKMRHSLITIEDTIGRKQLLLHRDTLSDCFANTNRPEELARDGLTTLLYANFKRGQEAARVIEEYAKIACNNALIADLIKTCRFSLYNLEKELLSGIKS